MKTTTISFGPDPKNPAIAGGAYLVLMKKVFPQGCNTDKEAEEANAFFDSIMPWVNEQTKEVKEAYIWSINYMKAIIKQNLEQTRKHEASCAASLTIPRPPGL